MGYSTYFSGVINIDPPLPPDMRTDLNNFFKERHEEPDMPNIWCDLEISEDGSSLYWNGNEKTYDLQYWIKWLIERKFILFTLNGQLDAQGDDPDDAWLIDVRDNVVYVQHYIQTLDPATRAQI